MKNSIELLSLLRIKPKALRKVGKYLAQANHQAVVIVWGEGMREKLSVDLFSTLRKSKISIIKEFTGSSLHFEDISKEALDLPLGATAVLGIGGGKALDIAKTFAFLKQLAFISVPTSLATDALASPTSSLLASGKKISLKTVTPEMVIVDTEIVAGAPTLFLQSGIGDIVSKFSAIYDWKLAYHKTGLPLNDYAVLISLSSAEHFSLCEVKPLHDLAYIRSIASSLVMSGLACSISKNSRPASGSEHLISHALDQILATPRLHGLQVALGTLIAARLQKNPHTELIERILRDNLIIDYWKKNPLHLEELRKAIELAPTIKSGFYTILSVEGKVEEGCALLLQDPLLRTFVLEP